MRVAEFIRSHPDEIEAAWETFARALSSFASDLSVSELRNHLRDILLAMADDVETPQSQEEQAEKSKGKAMRGSALDRITELHAGMRLDSGFNLEHAISEYRALRSSIFSFGCKACPAMKCGASRSNPL
jgi:hypothetical protein